MENNKFDFDPSKFDATYVRVGVEAHEIIDFITRVNNLPRLIKNELQDANNDEDYIEYEYEFARYMTDRYVENVPIFLYPLIENNLKTYLLDLYKNNLTDKYNSSTKTYKEKIEKSNIETIITLYTGCSKNINLKSLSNYEIIEEIRLLNNCIKHNNAIVDNNLSNINSFWNEGEEVSATKINTRISTFANGIYIFFKELQNNIS